MSRQDLNQRPALNSQYKLDGESIEYAGETYLAMIWSDQTALRVDRFSVDQTSVIAFRVRRYDGFGPAVAAVGDSVVYDGRKFSVSMMPTELSTKNELVIVAQRMDGVEKGSPAVAGYGRL